MNQKRVFSFSIGIGMIAVMGISVPVFAAKTLTEKQAQEIAAKAAPKEAAFVQTEDDDGEYEVSFYHEKKLEWYVVDVDKTSQKVTSFDSQLTNHSGSKTVEINGEKAKQIVEKELKDAEVLSVELEKDDGLYHYEVKFNAEKFYGEYIIHPVSGSILVRDITVGAPGKNSQNTTTDYLSREAVRKIALKQYPEGVIEDMDLEWKNGALIYEIEIEQNGKEADMVIDAKSGEILWNKQEGSDGKPVQTKENNTVIGLEKAKKIVLEKAPGATIKECELDDDDGVKYYEGELYKNGVEYEFKLDAKTGKILEWKEEWDD